MRKEDNIGLYIVSVYKWNFNLNNVKLYIEFE